MTPAELTTIKNEILTDPRGYGFAPHVASGDHGAIAAILMTVRGANATPPIVINRYDVTPLEILEAVDVRDFVSNANVLWGSWFESITQYPTVRLKKPNGADTLTKNNLDRIVTNQNLSQDRLNALAVRYGTRVEELLGAGRTINYFEVGDALRS